MKLLLLRVLLQRRARDEGFTLPMVIALGLVMLLLGTTNIVKSNEENLNAITQNSTSDALAIAEVGITKYREFLDQNRILTVYNHNQWTSSNVDGVNVRGQMCHKFNEKPPGWTGTASQPSDTAYTATDKTTDDNDNWWEVTEDVDGNGVKTIGYYRLVSYEYDIDGNTGDADGDGNPDDTDDTFSVVSDANTEDDDSTKANYQSITDENDIDDDGESNAIGILVVQGRSLDGSEAQIKVDIPLRINQQDMNNLAPALWINSRDTGSYLSNIITNLGNLDIEPGNNIVLSSIPDKNGCTDPSDDGSNVVIGDPRRVPPIKYVRDITISGAKSASQIQNTLSLDSSGNNFIVGKTTEKPYRDLNQKEIDNGETFTQSKHCKDLNKCRYYFDLGSSPFTIDKPTFTDGIAKTTLYINSDLTIDRVNVGSGVSSSYLEIYVDGNREVTVNTPIAGTIVIDAFIHAPGSVLKITGLGNVTFRGSVWVKEILNSTTGNVKIEPDNTNFSSSGSDKSYEYYTTTFTRTPRPLTGSPTNWVREEVK